MLLQDDLKLYDFGGKLLLLESVLGGSSQLVSG